MPLSFFSFNSKWEVYGMQSKVLEILCKLNDPRLVAVYSYGHRNLYDNGWCQETYDQDYKLNDHDGLIDAVVGDWFRGDLCDLKISFKFNDDTWEVMGR